MNMRVKLVGACIYPVLLFTSATSFAQEKNCIPAMLPGINLLLVFNGNCSEATYRGENQTSTCTSQAVSTGYNSGRTGFTFTPNPGVPVVFVGGKSSQPSKTMFVLEIDSMTASNVKSKADGKCSMNTLDPNAAILSCKVMSSGKVTSFRFVAGGPPRVTQFCAPK